MQYPIGKDEDEQRRRQRFEDGDDDQLRAVAAQQVEFEELPGREGDERQRDVRNEFRALYDAGWDDIEAAWPQRHPGQDVRRDVRKLQRFGDTCRQEAAKQHDRHGDDDHGDWRCSIQMRKKF